MSLSASLFGSDSAIFKATNILGLGVPGLLNKWFGAEEQKPTTQRIGEMASQTAKEGGARPIVWGRVRPISGNMMHVSEPKIKKVEVKGESSGGKGGSKKPAKQYQERVYRSYAIRICEGPITAIMRVWRNNKLVYDARGNEWGDKNNPVFLKSFKFYLGGWDQMPDPTLEGIWGAGDVPAYRGTCYMVSTEEDLTEMSGSIPQFVFEVERAEGVPLTSRPYAIEDIDEATGEEISIRETGFYYKEYLESSGIDIVSGALRDLLLKYDQWTHEDLESSGLDAVSGNLRATLKRYENWPAESNESTGIDILYGDIRVALIKYQNWPVESIESTGMEIIGGTLS